jgi:hypothetical protein
LKSNQKLFPFPDGHSKLILHFLERKLTSVDLQFLTLHQFIDVLDGFHLRIDIRHEGYVFLVFVDAQA